MKRLTLILLLFLIPALALAQGPGTNYSKQGGAEWVVGGSLDIVSGGVWKIAGTTITASAADLNSCDYTLVVAKTYAGQQTIESTGAGNDITLTAADDLRFLPSDALTVLSGGSSSVTTTAGNINLIAGGTTEDVSIQSVDDVILAATDDTTVAGDQFAVNTTSVVIDAGTGADEITVVAGITTVVGQLIMPMGTAPPAACAAGTKGGVYYDTDLNELCICNATNWLEIKDMTTGCS